jgi:transcriptional regulator with PAS, ATPase and Fis domain
MQRLFRTVGVVAPTEATVLLQGDTGTGKDLLARVIHNLSPRSSGPYVKVNCAAIPASLLESQLFGYRKGAFTDAREDRPGLFAEAQGGSIFLDEVGDIPLESQAKLLQVLDEQQYIPLGATSPESVDVRLMAATNRDLAAMADRGVFRPDLFYRLRVVELALPPLSERRCDIPLLIDHFLNEFSALQGKTAQELSPRALKVLLDYHYPGNVRELRHIIEHGVILSTGETIHAADLPHYLLSGPRPAVPGEDASAETDERTRLRQHLDRHGWRMNEAAQALGIDRTTLWRRRRKHGL